MNPDQLSLGDFVKQLALLMEKGHLDMPFKEDVPWHSLFYRLKNESHNEGRPQFLDTLRFDWDGPYPKSQELSDFIQALHWTGTVAAVNPSYEKIMIQEKVGELWSKYAVLLDTNTTKFLQQAFEMAKEEFRETKEAGEARNANA